jgi:hypothetical protein
MRSLQQIACILVACVALASCSHGDFSLSFPGGYYCERVASGWYVLTRKEQPAEAGVVVIEGNVDRLGYSNGVIFGHVSRPSQRFAPFDPERAGYFVIMSASDELFIGLGEDAFAQKRLVLGLENMELFPTEEFASRRSKTGVVHRPH